LIEIHSFNFSRAKRHQKLIFSNQVALLGPNYDGIDQLQQLQLSIEEISPFLPNILKNKLTEIINVATIEYRLPGEFSRIFY
jgi:hypothetical protein